MMDLGKSIYKLMFKAVRFSPYLTWKLGAIAELWYMFNWLKTPIKDWSGPEDLSFCCDPKTSLQGFLVELINAPVGSTVRILDVGAGPLTCLGKIWEGRNVKITPIDALAREYNILLKLHRIRPPIITSFAYAERLTTKFPLDYFDLIHARNSIDHTINPFEAIKQMLAVLKPYCYIVMRHYVNEGETANYTGLHQWDLTTRGDSLILKRAGRSINITEELIDIAKIHCEHDSQGMLITRIMKKLPS